MLLYLKQAWQILKQNRFYSAIYILGTGLSISMVMILAIVFYIKIANIYPETSRDRLLIIKCAEAIAANGSNGTSGLSLITIEACIYPLKTAEAISVIYNGYEENFVQPDNSDEQIPVSVKFVDNGFWNVFSFSFLYGKPFTEADMQSGIRTVVISASFARQIFGRVDVEGEYIRVNFDPYRICGVVKDVSFIADKTFAQLWMPYTATQENTSMWSEESYANSLGDFAVYILAHSTKEINKLKEEITENINKYNTSLGDIQFLVHNQPDRQWQTIFRYWGGQVIDFNKVTIQYILIFLILLLVPAVSLSGMTDSQMERRLSEMGVRRVFGAPRHKLLGQLVAENFLFTLLGGATGLLISYVLVYSFRSWITNIGIGQVFLDVVPEGVDVALTPSMLMNYTVFIIALGICFVLNILVTIIPAWRASRREIIYSLNAK